MNEDHIVFEYLLIINSGANTTKKIFYERKNSIYPEYSKSDKYQSSQPALFKLIKNRLRASNLVIALKNNERFNKTIYMLNWSVIIERFFKKVLDPYDFFNDFNECIRFRANNPYFKAVLIKIEEQIDKIKRNAFSSDELLKFIEENSINTDKIETIQIQNILYQNRLILDLVISYFEYLYDHKNYLDFTIDLAIDKFSNDFRNVSPGSFFDDFRSDFPLPGKVLYSELKKKYTDTTLTFFELILYLSQNSTPFYLGNAFTKLLKKDRIISWKT